MNRTQGELTAYRQGALDTVEALAAGLDHLAAVYADRDEAGAARAREAADVVRLMRPAVCAVTRNGLRLVNVDQGQLDELLGERTP